MTNLSREFLMKMNKPENMHNKVCKMALGVRSKASNLAAKGEL